jgi:hypothetical protein
LRCFIGATIREMACGVFTTASKMGPAREKSVGYALSPYAKTPETQAYPPVARRS